MIAALVVFTAAYSTVLLLGLQSKLEQYIFWSGLGGSLGIVSAHFLYEWYDRRFKR